jgi:hypothetical protein
MTDNEKETQRIRAEAKRLGITPAAVVEAERNAKLAKQESEPKE